MCKLPSEISWQKVIYFFELLYFTNYLENYYRLAARSADVEDDEQYS